MRVKTQAHLFLKGSMIHKNSVSIINKHSFFKSIFFILTVLLLPFLSKGTPGLFDFLATGQGAQQGLPSVIIFYEPDCAHCKKMSKQLQEAAGFDKALQRRFYVELADITTVKGKELARKFNIRSVPAILQSEITAGKYNTINGFPGVDKLADLLQMNYKLPETLNQQHAVVGGVPQCGNGSIEAGEQCDDANVANGDGCSATCQVEGVSKGVAINETGQLPDISSILDVSSENKGLLIPRVTNNQMLGIALPANGLLIYNIDSACFAYRNATAWVFLKGNGTASNDWSTKGNAGTNPAVNFIGTTDNRALNFRVNNLNAGSIDPVLLNTFLGSESGTSTQTGVRNVAMGYLSLRDNGNGGKNTAIGVQSLRFSSTGSDNTAVGYDAMFFNSSGSRNTAYGENSLGSLRDGNDNIAIGRNSLYGNLSGSDNVAVGNQAGYGNTGNSNVFLGNNAGFFETGSNKLYIQNSNVVSGEALLYGEFDNKILSVGGKLGIGNTAPHGDLHLPQTLANRKIVLLEDFDNDHQFNGFGINTFIMRYQAAATTSSHVFYAGTSATTSNELMRITGNGEVGVGKVPFITNNDSRLQIKQKGIQNGVGIEAPNSTNHWDLYVTTDAASNFILYYNGTNKGAFDNVTGAYTANSDRRLKKDITQQQPVLNNVMQLQAYQYHYLDNQPTDRFSNGFMAQDVQKLFPDAVVENTMKDGQTRLGINYQYFTVLAIKGLQEQQIIINDLQKQVEAAKAEIPVQTGKQQQQIQSQEEKISLQEKRIEKLEAALKTLMPKN